MKCFLLHLLICSILIPFPGECQVRTVGLSVGYHSFNGMDFDINYRSKQNRFHVGGTVQFADRVGKRVKDRLSNYGGTITGSGEFISSFDFGYSRFFMKAFNLQILGSAGVNSYYKNYKDDRFNGGGYHHVYDSDVTFGVGGYLGYLVTQTFEVYAGYHSFREFGGGIRFNFKIN